MPINQKLQKLCEVFNQITASSKISDFFFLVFSVNYQCNARCRMCSIWQRYKDEPDGLEQELSVSQIRRIFENSKYLRRIKYILIGGGEPFIKKDFVDIFLFFYDVNPSVITGMATNGYSTELIIDKLKEMRSGLNQRHLDKSAINLAVSIDAIGQLHDTMRGVRGIFENAIKTLEKAKAIPNLNLQISFTMTPMNYRDLFDVYELSKKFKVSFSFRFAQKSAVYYGNEDKQFLWTAEQINEANDLFMKFKQDFFPNGSTAQRLLDTNRYFYHRMFDYQRHPKRLHKCFAGKLSCFIDPYGNLYPCIMLDKRLGNLKKDSFDCLWESQESDKARDFIRKNKCYCFSGCDLPVSLPREPRLYLWNIKEILIAKSRK